MVQIFEHQYEKGNKDNFQERTINYESFDQYELDITNDKQKGFHPSLPRQTNILFHSRNGNAMVLEFENSLIQKIFVHTAIVVTGKEGIEYA